MDELLKRLETGMRTLIEDYNQVNKGHFTLAKEKEAILAREKQVISQIEMLVSKLKSVEKWS